jgi:hypothetical protein
VRWDHRLTGGKGVRSKTSLFKKEKVKEPQKRILPSQFELRLKIVQ